MTQHGSFSAKWSSDFSSIRKIIIFSIQELLDTFFHYCSSVVFSRECSNFTHYDRTNAKSNATVSLPSVISALLEVVNNYTVHKKILLICSYFLSDKHFFFEMCNWAFLMFYELSESFITINFKKDIQVIVFANTFQLHVFRTQSTSV